MLLLLLNLQQPLILENCDRVNKIIFSPNGKTVASVSADTTVKLWKVYSNNLNDLIFYSCARLRDYLQSNPKAIAIALSAMTSLPRAINFIAGN